MKYSRIYSPILLFISTACLCFGQVKSLGFTQKVVNPQNSFVDGYFPKLQVENDTLFVCSNTGIYQKDMKQDTDWELFSFEEIPVIEFIKKEKELLALSTGVKNGQDSLLFYSKGKGKICMNFTSDHFLEYGNNYLYRIAQNPQKPDHALILDVVFGISKSYDFGKNWFYLNTNGSIGQHVNFMSFHPLDTATIFYCGETEAFGGKIYQSSDSGNTWTSYQVPGGDNCVHQIDFHPTDPNILIFGGEGVIGKSTDKGKTWQINDLYNTSMYFYKVLFDKDNPNIIYASGPNSRHREDDRDTIWVYRSTDMGESWHLAYKEYLGANGGQLIDMVKYKDKLIFYTRELGVLQLDLKTTPVVSLKDVSVKRDITVYPNPVVKTMHFQTDKTVWRVDLMDSTGKRVQSSLLGENERSVDVSRLSEGIYLAVFYAEEQRMTEKICIARQQ